tara:strand:- start:2196 stop:4052 length:1857 start_codon:yes stop_codon:yes gene_type:complete
MVKYVEKRGNKFWPSKQGKKISLVSKNIYNKGKNPEKFWAEQAEQLDWFEKWDKVYEQKGNNFKWFLNGKINLCYNAVDRHLDKKNPAIIWVPESLKEKKLEISYKKLYEMVNSAAYMLKQRGIKKGDVVALYCPLIPEALAFMLACSRLGVIHSVVFSAFSADALKTRLKDGKAKLLISCDYYFRKGEKQDLLKKVNEATRKMKIKKIIIKRNRVGRFLKKSKEVRVEEMESNEPLFILYTSGTTGKPKGVIHDTGGYSVQAITTIRFNFNVNSGTRMWCTADIGWVTGHTYVCYGPLLVGATTLIYEGVTTYPSPERLFKIIQENKIEVLYTAPTAIRIFALEAEKYAKKYKLNSLKVLGTVGEPIDEEAWLWYFNNIGKGRCPVIDTWWQTETGGTLINSLAGVGPFVPTFAGKSFPGTKHEIVNNKGRRVKNGKPGFLVQIPPYAPGMLRGVWKNEKRYNKYFKNNVYFTGDNAFRKADEFRILGRADDIIKVAGHRLSTAEIENIVTSHPSVSESAVVSKPDKIKGEAIVIFIKLKKGKKITDKEIVKRVRDKISPIASPSEVYFVEDLPKTRSGKIMRRVLKGLLVGDRLKSLTTLVNPEVVDKIEKIIRKI